MEKKGTPAGRSRPPSRRKWLTIPVTEAMLAAIKRAARRKGSNQSNFARMLILAQTEYDSDSDPDLPALIGERDEP